MQTRQMGTYAIKTNPRNRRNHHFVPACIWKRTQCGVGITQREQKRPGLCIFLRVTQRKQHRTGITKNDNTNGTNQTTINPTKQLQNSQHMKLYLIHLSSDPSHISRHSFSMNSKRTAHKHRNPQATQTHSRPRQGSRNSTATRLLTPM